MNQRKRAITLRLLAILLAISFITAFVAAILWPRGSGGSYIAGGVGLVLMAGFVAFYVRSMKK